MQSKTRIAMAIALMVLVVFVTACTSSSNDSSEYDKYKGAVGGGCGVSAGIEPQTHPALMDEPAPGA